MTRLLTLCLAAFFLPACNSTLQARVVTLEGRAIEVASAGDGGVTVVFEAGLGNDWSSWDSVAGEVAKEARVFAYSRPGYGRSGAANSPRDGLHIVEELRALLAAQGYAPPYILVGHSFGGTYMELFAKAHPGEVAAAVLVEPRPAGFLARCEAESLPACGITEDQLASLPAVQIAEYRAFPQLDDELRQAGAFGNYPVRVLTASSSDSARTALWVSMHHDLAAEAADGEQLIFKGAGHNLQVERVGEVAKVVLELVVAQRR